MLRLCFSHRLILGRKIKCLLGRIFPSLKVKKWLAWKTNSEIKPCSVRAVVGGHHCPEICLKDNIFIQCDIIFRRELGLGPCPALVMKSDRRPAAAIGLGTIQEGHGNPGRLNVRHRSHRKRRLARSFFRFEKSSRLSRLGVVEVNLSFG